MAAFLGASSLASSVFIATCCCLLPQIRLLTQPQAHRPGPQRRVSYLLPCPQDTEQELLGEETGRGQGKVGQGEGMPSSKTPPEGQCVMRQEPRLELQVVSLGPRRGSPGIISHWFPSVAAALSA